MGRAHSKIVQLVRQDDAGTLREMIAKHGASLLSAKYEHKNNEQGWPSFGAYLLGVAVDCEAVECLKVVSQHTDIVTKSKEYSETVLHRAARNGNLKACKVLIGLGAQVEACDDFGNTPLHDAVRGGQLSTARLLMSSGAGVNCQSKDGMTPLHCACYCGNVELVRDMLTAGADATIRCKRQRTAKDMARAAGRANVVQFLDSLSGKATVSAAEPALSTAGDLPQARQWNLWDSEQDLQQLDALLSSFSSFDGDAVLAECYSSEMVTAEQYDELRAEGVPSKQRAAILAALSKVPNNFVKLRDLSAMKLRCSQTE